MTTQIACSRTLFAAAVIVLVGSCSPALCEEPLQNLPAGLADNVDVMFAKWNRPDSPGCAVGIVYGERLVYSKGFGSANLTYQALNTPQTVFETASFSKTVTCLCLALLMDEGKISPEDELRKFIPEMHAFDPPIRIRDMVRCRSGIWDQVSIPILVGWENAPQQTPHTEADVFSLLAGQKRLPFPAGTAFRYSSGDYFLLGMIIERITGQSMTEFARRRVFEPLGMMRTFYDDDPTRVVRDRAVGHFKPGGDAWHLWRPTAYWIGGGQLTTCVEDLVKLDQNFANNRLPRGKYVDELLGEGTLLGNGACLDVDANRQEADPEARRESPPGQYRGLKRRQFTGGAWGFSTAMTQFPEQELTVICLSNCDEIAAWTMTGRIADLVLANRLGPLPAGSAKPAAKEEATVEVPEASLRDKVGSYRIKRGGQIWRISLAGGKLHVTDHLMKTYAMRSISATRFDPEGPFYATTRFVFSRKAADGPMAMVSEWDEPDNRGRLELEPIELVAPTREQLAEYAGEFVSDELAATYRLELRGERLWLRVNSRRWEELDATIRDEFIPHQRAPAEARILTFLRSSSGEVNGLSVEYYRVTGVRFAKR